MASAAAIDTLDILPNQTLYVKNLPEDVNTQDLRCLLYELFIPYGEIIDVMARRTRTLRGQAFVVFLEIGGAIAALKGVNGRLFLGKPISVEYAKNTSYKALKPGDAYRRLKNRTCPAPEDTAMSVDSVSSHVLLVENFPKDMEAESVELLFRQYPGYQAVRFVKGRGVAFVDFATLYQAEVALQGLQGFKVGHNYELRISAAKA